MRDEPSDSEENGSETKTYFYLSLGNWKSLPLVASLREVRPLEGNYSLRAPCGPPGRALLRYATLLQVP